MLLVKWHDVIVAGLTSVCARDVVVRIYLVSVCINGWHSAVAQTNEGRKEGEQPSRRILFSLSSVPNVAADGRFLSSRRDGGHAWTPQTTAAWLLGAAARARR